MYCLKTWAILSELFFCTRIKCMCGTQASSICSLSSNKQLLETLLAVCVCGVCVCGVVCVWCGVCVCVVCVCVLSISLG